MEGRSMEPPLLPQTAQPTVDPDDTLNREQFGQDGDA